MHTRTVSQPARQRQPAVLHAGISTSVLLHPAEVEEETPAASSDPEE